MRAALTSSRSDRISATASYSSDAASFSRMAVSSPSMADASAADDPSAGAPPKRLFMADVSLSSFS